MPQPPKKTPRSKTVKKVPVHAPGTDAIYSDKDLVNLPFTVLSEEQIERKKLLERRIRNNNRNKANKALRDKNPDPHPERISCEQIKANGERCGAWQAYGSIHCRHHMTDTELKKAGVIPTRGSGAHLISNREKGLSPQQMARSVVEQTFAFAMNKRLNIFGLQIDSFDAMGNPIISEIPGGGVKMFGESKDGEIIMTNIEDLAAMSREIEMLWNRVMGKPRQTTVIEGGAKPVEVRPVRSVERSTEVASILGQIGALPKPHNGRSRRQTPSESNRGVEHE
jgi:hypothetical protein